MKDILILSVLFAFAISVFGQSDSKGFVDFDQVKEQAKINEKNILMVFSGSDWCKPCIQFKHDILENELFQKWSNENIIILYLDFPARKKNQLPADQKAHNELLAEQYNQSGYFPYLLLMDAEGNLLSKPSFKNQEIDEFITLLDF